MQSNFTKTLLTGVCALALVVSPIFTFEAHAATDGTLGATSTGSLNINVTKDARVKISGLSDLQKVSWVDTDGDVVLREDFCVYSTRAGGGYKVNPSGSGIANAFTIANGANLLPYSLKWNDGGASLGEPVVGLIANTLSPSFANASTGSISCGGGTTARLEVKILSTNMAAAVDGAYAGTLTLIVSPS